MARAVIGRVQSPEGRSFLHHAVKGTRSDAGAEARDVAAGRAGLVYRSASMTPAVHRHVRGSAAEAALGDGEPGGARARTEAAG